MTLILFLNIVLGILLFRAAYMVFTKYYEWRGLPASAAPSEKALILDQLIGWTFTTISKVFFLTGGFLILYFGRQEAFDATDPVDWVVPLYLVGFLFLVFRQEVGAYMVKRRYRLFSEEGE